MAESIQRIEGAAKHETWRLAAQAFEKNDPDFFVKWGTSSPNPEKDVQFGIFSDNRLAGGLDIYWRVMSAPRGDITVGGIANVFTMPADRGRGLASNLMQHAVNFMKQNGYQMSILYGREDFYSRFGYSRVNRRYVSMKGRSSRRFIDYDEREIDLENDVYDLVKIHKAAENAGGVMIHNPDTYLKWARQKLQHRGDKGVFKVITSAGTPVGYWAGDERENSNPEYDLPQFKTVPHVTDFAAYDWALLPSLHLARLAGLKKGMDPVIWWTPQIQQNTGKSSVRISEKDFAMVQPLDLSALAGAYEQNFQEPADFIQYLNQNGLACQDFDTL